MRRRSLDMQMTFRNSLTHIRKWRHNHFPMKPEAGKRNVVTFSNEGRESSTAKSCHPSSSSSSCPEPPSIVGKQKRNRSVSFNTINTKVHLIEKNDNGEDNKIHDTSQNNNSLWYTQAELSIIEQQNMALADLMTNHGVKLLSKEDGGGNHDNMGCFLRGLEQYTHQKEYFSRWRRAKRTRKAVILEQRRQKEQGINDPSKIAAVYLKLGASQSNQEAYAVGLSDYLTTVQFDSFSSSGTSNRNIIPRT